MSHRAASVVAALVLTLATALTASLPAQSVPTSGDGTTPPNTPPRGTGLIAGRVVEGTSSRPVAGAIVTLGTSRNAVGQYAVMADDQGRFVVRDLPKGAFTIRAYRTGYIDGAFGKGDPAPQAPTGVFDLADDERVGDVVIRLWKVAAIGGTVTDERGDPLVNIVVRALPRRTVGGRRLASLESGPTYTAVTDDRGIYRLALLPPGDYIVAVPVTATSWPKSLSRLLAAGGARGGGNELTSAVQASSRWVGGGGAGNNGLTLVDAGDSAFGLIDSFRAGGRIDGSPSIAGIRADGTLLVYETQYFSSAASLAQATIVSLASGEERSNVDIHLRPVPAVSVSGTLVGPDGPAKDYVLRLVHADTAGMSSDPEIADTASDQDGRFTFLGITPGQYAIRVLKLAPPSAPSFWAETPVTVGDRAVTDVTVSLRRGLRISGRVVFEGSAERPADPRLGVKVERADGTTSTNLSLAFGTADAQGNFSTYGQLPGKYFIRVPVAPAGWNFVGAMLGGRDVSVMPLDLLDADVEGVVLTLSDKPLAEISGTVTVDRGSIDPTLSVLVFPTDKQLWTNNGESPRNLRTVAIGRNGRYSATNLPPGNYFVAAVAAAARATDADALEALSRSAIRVTVAAGERKSQNVPVAGRAPGPGPDPDAEPRPHGPFLAEDQTQTPTRDARPPEPSGSGIISGVVVSDEPASKPLRRARVTLNGSGLGGRLVFTDDEGRFVFKGVPAGRFTLQAQKDAYLVMYHGARRPGVGDSGTAITLVDGGRLTDVTLKLPRGAVITGLVRDERGQPAPGLNVQAIRVQTVAAGRGGASAAATTDDRGIYRMHTLDAGEYLIELSPRASNAGNVQATTQADLDFAAAALSGGRGAAVPAGGRAAQAPARRSVAFAPVFYPGVTSISDAQKVTVAYGEERSGIDVALQLIPTAHVEGVVASPGPLPPNVDVRLTPVSGPTSGPGASSPTQRPDAAGRFSFAGVAPGQYVVSAVTSPVGGRGATGSGSPSLWATAEVAVNGLDVAGVQLTLQPGMTVRGKVTFDPTTLTPPADLSVVSISLQPLLTGGQISVGTLSSTVGADGTFAIPAVMPGRYRVATAMRLSPGSFTGWILRSAMVQGTDAIDLPFDVRPNEDVSGIAVTFTDRAVELTGVLLDEAGKPAPNYTLIVFPEDKILWGAGPRRVTTARPGSDGSFAVRTLRPGNYLLAAVTDLAPGAANDPDFLESLVGAAIKVTLAEGDKKVQNVRIGRLRLHDVQHHSVRSRAFTPSCPPRPPW
jgi:protocatechuate 3,4-dioxygenase beta subunit